MVCHLPLTSATSATGGGVVENSDRPVISILVGPVRPRSEIRGASQPACSGEHRRRFAGAGYADD